MTEKRTAQEQEELLNKALAALFKIALAIGRLDLLQEAGFAGKGWLQVASRESLMVYVAATYKSN